MNPLAALCVMLCGVASVLAAPKELTLINGPELPIAIGGHAAGLVGGKPVVAGGTGWTADKTHKFWSRDTFVFADGQWTKGRALPQPIADMAYASDESGLYLLGGTSDKVPTSTAFRLRDTSAGAAWEKLPDLPEPIQAASAAIVNKRLYVVAGYVGERASNRTWSFALDQSNAKWEARAPLPGPGRGWAATTARDGKLYYFGGFVSPPYEKESAVFGDAWTYDPSTDQWQKLPAFNLPGYAWSAINADDAILLVGRCPVLGQTSDEIWSVRPQDGATEPAGKLPQPNCCMAVVPNGPGTWWITGGEPAATRIRSASVVVLSR